MALFSEFPTITKEEWLAKIEKDLKGKSLESLNWKIHEDWVISPLAHSKDWNRKEAAIVKKENNSWEIGEKIVVKNTSVANQDALAALEGGVNALLFELPESFTPKDFEILLQGIELEWISVHFQSDESCASFLDHLKEKEIDSTKIKGSWRSKKKEILGQQAHLPQFKLLSIDGTEHYQGTSQTIEELTQILLATNNTLTQIEPHQVNSLQASVAIGESYFINIAKIRALKILLYNLLQAYQLKTPLQLEAHLASASLTNNQHQNMIQMSTQALSAVVGGIDCLFLTPAPDFTTAFTKRIARNVQHLLQLESHLDHVIDPAAGSYYIENLTNEMVKRTWSAFKSKVL
ncbi:MAG: methylmalonyl-CoA mutase family protein [Bacteroidota bacterium]